MGDHTLTLFPPSLSFLFFSLHSFPPLVPYSLDNPRSTVPVACVLHAPAQVETIGDSYLCAANLTGNQVLVQTSWSDQNGARAIIASHWCGFA
jgi:hypothetical protein